MANSLPISFSETKRIIVHRGLRSRAVLKNSTCAFFLFLCFSAAPSNAQDVTERDNITFAIESASAICLSGEKYKLYIGGKGELRIAKLRPNGDVSATIEASRSRGGVDFEDEKVRELVDDKTRACLQETWPKVADRISKKSPAIAPSRSVVSFQFSRNWIRYLERVFTPNTKDRPAGEYRSPYANAFASIEIDGENVGLIAPDTDFDSITKIVSPGEHILTIRFLGNSGNTLKCSREFDVDGRSTFDVIAIVNKNITAGPQNVICKIDKISKRN